MAIAAYSTDLADVTTTDDNTNWSELTNHTGGSAAATEGDYYIQGSACVSQAFGTKTGTAAGLEFDYLTNIAGFAAGDVFLFWQVCLAGNAMNTWANGGTRLCVGSTTGNVNFWISGGSNFGRNPYGGWPNIAIDPTFTADFTEGTPVAGNYRIFGSTINLVSQVSKGNMHGMDKIRFGRAEIIITDGQAAAYGTVAGMAAANDAQAARWGLMQAIAGGYLWKGLWSLGTTATAVDFRDTNRSITIDEVPRTYASFNKIEVNNAASIVQWTGFTISAPITSVTGSILSKGEFEAIANATITKDTCIFNDMSTFIYQSASTILDSTYRRCGLITQGGATFTNSTIVDSAAAGGSPSAAAMSVDNPSTITYCNFISGGIGHAIEATSATVSGSPLTGTYNWVGNTDTGYTGTRGTNLVPNSGSTDAMFYNNSNGLITLNVSGGGQAPSVRNGTGATTVINNNVNVTFTGMQENTEVRIYKTSDGTVVAGIEDVIAGSPLARSFTWSAAAALSVYYVIHNNDYETIRVEGFIVPATDTSIPIQQRIDRNYDNPPG